MAIITLEYDSKNMIAKKTIDYILSLGVFKRKDNKKLTGVELAIQEIEEGKTVKCKDFDDYKRKTQDV